MRSNAKLRALAHIVIGLIGIAAYQIIVHFKHPVIMDNDLFHGMWFGICFGLEITGLYLLSKTNADQQPDKSSCSTSI